MTNEIIELLPSEDLKAKIRETGHHFSEGQLLQIIYEYAPSFEKRIELLERFARVAAPDISEQARVFISTQQNNFKNFVEKSEGFIYELHIKDTPDSYDERYLCASYEAALAFIDLFYEKYADIGTKETDESRYMIVKRKIFSGSGKFEEDNYGECSLGPNKTLLKVDDYENEFVCELHIPCSDCDKICPRREYDLLFPCFVCDRALIRYRGHGGEEHFGVSLCDGNNCDELADCLYVIPLDSNAVSYHDFENDFNAHVHVELPLAETASIEDLDETMRNDYLEYLKYLDTKES